MCVCVSSLGASEQTLYPRNEKLDQKISLYSGDITKLEVDAIVNAGTREGVKESGDPCLDQSCSIVTNKLYSHVTERVYTAGGEKETHPCEEDGQPVGKYDHGLN